MLVCNNLKTKIGGTLLQFPKFWLSARTLEQRQNKYGKEHLSIFKILTVMRMF